MSKLIPSLENFTRCHDTSEPISNFKAPRGQAGVSIIAITIATEPMLCIINAYMPTINTNSEIQYSECLDIIFDIIEKHQSKYVIILAGDLNGTLFQTRTNKDDKLLREFVQMCKVLYNKWADLGKPIGHPLSLELKTHKQSVGNANEWNKSLTEIPSIAKL
ncbi:unnamed protein product [Mytilus edulis]|uniref:Endonuclease/exonuclease/phosphatase domain-containing protein n=1 Tax=Mytilus edulis TaxID=6550 RepID=A0A8S3SS75_MYTED|nr:unnamed protein product [Mytilus edulis]